MNILLKLSAANLAHRTARTFYLTVLSVFMCFSVFLGTTLVMGMDNGLRQLRERLGADIIVVPREEAAVKNIEGILFSGKPGYFYMDKSVFEEISRMEGIEHITSQFYLSSVNADCCYTEIQLIGFDPQTDFIVRPWLKKSYDQELKKGEVIAGSNVLVPDSRILKIFNNDLTAVGSLEKTGTGLDSAVFGTVQTIKELMKSSAELGHLSSSVSPDSLVSSVLFKVKDGTSRFKLAREINKRFKEVRAIENQDLIRNFSTRLEVVSTVVKTVVGIIWILSLLIMILYFSMSLNERRREFAVLKVMGFTDRAVCTVIYWELLFILCAGAIAGFVLSSFWSLQLRYYLESRLEVPFLFESTSSFLLHGGTAVAASILLTLLSLLLPVIRTGRKQVFTVLREVD